MEFYFNHDLCPDSHHKRSYNNKDESGKRFLRQLFLKHKIGKQYGYNDTEFINGDDHADETVLNGIVITDPGSTRRQSGKNQKQ